MTETVLSLFKDASQEKIRQMLRDLGVDPDTALRDVERGLETECRRLIAALSLQARVLIDDVKNLLSSKRMSDATRLLVYAVKKNLLYTRALVLSLAKAYMVTRTDKIEEIEDMLNKATVLSAMLRELDSAITLLSLLEESPPESQQSP